MVGCFFKDLGLNILRNMMVRCVENIVNTDVFLKSQIFDFFDILGSSGRPGTSFGRLFGRLGPHFGGPQGAGNMLQYLLCLARPGWLAGLDPGGARTRSGEGNWKCLAPRTSSTTDCWTGTTGLKDCRN